ncbi:MAG TPA: discoidin domain-containing protein [Fervidobacterium sp.]|nr:discoidin domain-containing protein [Fervidobacterium sp.]
MGKLFKNVVLILLILSVLSFCQEENEIQFKIPESSYWYPNDLIDWSPNSDPDAIYNVSKIPLQPRIAGPKLSQYASENVKVVALSIMNSSTSGMPSQGRNDSMKVYPFTYWQYIDYLVAWAGSAGEGIIVSPGADTIGAAHKNGVPVLGTIYFGPNVYGGRRNWVDQLIQEENGIFPVADKLIEVARYYGFDGWFINQETEGCEQEQVVQMIKFMEYFKEKAPDLILFWYDAMNNTGEVAWQGELNETNVSFLMDNGKRVADYMFIDFGWISSKMPNTIDNSVNNAKKYGISQYDLFAGVLLQGDGYNTPYFNLPKIQDKDGKLRLSLGLYGPCWSYYSSKTFDEFWKKENILWIGNHDGLVYNEKDSVKNWSGFAKFVVEKSPVTSIPFVTNFNVGHGKYFFVDGKKVKATEWHNRSLQDVLPTYRWKVAGKVLNVNVDYDDAYYGGTSLEFSGNMNKGDTSEYTLYFTNLSVTSNTVISYATKINAGKISGCVIVVLSDGQVLKLPLSTLNTWRKYSYPLSEYAGKKVVSIGLSVKSMDNQDVSLNLGQIAFYETNNKNIANVESVTIDDVNFSEGIYAQVKLHWNEIAGARFYEIYRILPDKSEELVWASTNNYTYIYNMKRTGKEDETILKVVAVLEDMKKSKPGYISFKWPQYPKPKADFSVNNTIIKPGDSVVFESLCSETTEQILWEFPGGIPSESTSSKVQVKYEKEGVYPVKLTAKNTSGEDVKSFDSIIVVTDNAEKITNLALGKNTYASSFVPAEKPSLAVDGTVENNSKWCAVGDLPHWLVIDLEKECFVNKIVIKHAEAGHESADWNTKMFRLQVSLDGENWQDVVVVQNNTKGITEHSFAPVRTRYVRFFIEMPTQVGDKAARIYEVEVYGLDSF